MKFKISKQEKIEFFSYLFMDLLFGLSIMSSTYITQCIGIYFSAIFSCYIFNRIFYKGTFKCLDHNDEGIITWKDF